MTYQPLESSRLVEAHYDGAWHRAVLHGWHRGDGRTWPEGSWWGHVTVHVGYGQDHLTDLPADRLRPIG